MSVAPEAAARLASIRLPPVALATVLFAGVVLPLILLRPPLPVDETRYLTVAWEMWGGGSKLVPHLNGELYGHKPPLLFWLINAVWSVTGVSELAARLVAPALAAASVALTGALARELWPDDGRAGRAALILATTGAFLVYGSATMFDAPLTAAVLAAMIALLRLSRGGGVRWAAALGAAVAFGVYAKGPVILVHVAPVALLAPLWRGPGFAWPPGRRAAHLLLALGVALALLALWLGPALVLGGPAYREEVLWRQSAGRMVQAFDHERPWWWFLALLPLYLWPWGWTPSGLAALRPRALLPDPSARFAAIWALSALVAFSLISGKQVHYLVPELPALALLLSRGPINAARAGRALLALPALLVLVVGAALALGLVGATPGAAVTVPVPALLAAGAIVAGATLLALHVLLSPVLAVTQDAGPLGRLLAGHEAAGVAYRDGTYHGQFGFAGRLTKPVDVLADDAALDAWAARHPGGVVLSRRPLEGATLPVIARRPFRSGTYTLYQVPGDAP